MIGEDKFMVVAIVMAIILIGIGAYLFFIDRKLSRLEKKQEELKSRITNN